MQLNIYNTAIISFIISVFVNWIVLYAAKYIEFNKSSDQIEKRLVNKNIPPLGGVATSIAFFTGVSFLGEADYNFALIGIFAILLSLVGAVDDFFNLKWKIKLFFQVLFAKTCSMKFAKRPRDSAGPTGGFSPGIRPGQLAKSI